MPIQTVNIHEAKTHLSKLLADVANGDEVVIAKAGYPIARLVSIRQPVRKRAFGKDAGLFEIPEVPRYRALPAELPRPAI